MRTAILIPVGVLLAAAGLAFAIVVAVPLAQDAVGPQSFVHIQTATGGDGEPVNLTLPFGAVGALLAMAPGAIAENGNIRLGEGQHLPVDTLRNLWAQVQSTSGPVTVEHEGAVIRVEQTGEQVAGALRAERRGHAGRAAGRRARRRAVGAADGGLDIEGAVQALEASPGEDIQRHRRRPPDARLDRHRSGAVGSGTATLPARAAASDPEHERWMRAALDQALQALEADEVPVGAVVVHDGRVAGAGFNQPIRTNDPTAHAEMVALRSAARALGNYRLTGAALYVTVEPCLMCAGALVHARIETLVYGAPEPRSGAVESVAQALDNPALNHRVSAVGGVLEAECRELMQAFFKRRRSAAPTDAAVGGT